MKKVFGVVIGLGIIAAALIKFWPRDDAPPPVVPPPPPPVVAQPPVPRVEPARAWTFAQADRINLARGGAVTVSAGGIVDATYLRTDGSNVVFKLIDGGTGTVAMESLSPEDLSYIESVGDGERERIKRKKTRWTRRIVAMPAWERGAVLEAIAEARESFGSTSARSGDGYPLAKAGD